MRHFLAGRSGLAPPGKDVQTTLLLLPSKLFTFLSNEVVSYIIFAYFPRYHTMVVGNNDEKREAVIMPTMFISR